MMFCFISSERWLHATGHAECRPPGKPDDEEEALGGGDVYLAGVLGLMLGGPPL